MTSRRSGSVHNNGMSSSAPAAVAAAAPTHPVDPISGGGDETNTNNNTTRADLPSAFVMQVTAIASLGGILFGYDLGVISGALPQLTQAFDLTNSQKESVVSILYVGGGLGAALGGSICDSFGRKRAIMITDCIFLVGGLMLYAAPSYFFLLLGRVVVGFAVALSGCADVCYLHEIAPVQWRGAIVSVNEACISLGFLLAFGVAHVLTYEGNTSGWRLMFGLSGVLAIVQFVGMRTLPESPSWLQERGRHHEAEEAMRRINSDLSFSQLLWTEDETRELSASDRGNQTIYSTIPRDTSVAALASGEDESVLRISSPSIRPNAPGLWGAMPQFCRQTWLLLMQFGSFAKTTMANYRKQAYVALFLSVTQQLCGQTNVLSYAPLIFASLDADDDSSNYVRGGATLLIGVVKFLVTVIVIWKIEQTGRRLLLLIGMCIIAVGLFLLTIAFGAVDVSDAQDGELQDKANGLIYALPGVLLVVSGYSMSFGPLTWLLTSELFPTEIRGRALGASTIVTYGTAAVVTSTFLTAQEMFGPSAVFGFYLLVTLVGLVFAFTAISETKGKSEAEIEQDLDQMLWWRRHGSSQSLMGETGSEMIRTESNDGLL